MTCKLKVRMKIVLGFAYQRRKLLETLYKMLPNPRKMQGKKMLKNLLPPQMTSPHLPVKLKRIRKMKTSAFLKLPNSTLTEGILQRHHHLHLRPCFVLQLRHLLPQQPPWPQVIPSPFSPTTRFSLRIINQTLFSTRFVREEPGQQTHPVSLPVATILMKLSLLSIPVCVV